MRSSEESLAEDVGSILGAHRVILTPVVEVDAIPIHNAVVGSLGSLREFPATMPWAQAEPTVENSLNFCKMAIQARKNRHDFIYAIRLKGDDTNLVGIVGVHKIDWNIPKFEIGFWCNTDFSKNGYIGESIGILLKYINLRFQPNRVEAIVDESNKSARKVCERAGFLLEGVLVNSRKDTVANSLRNLCIYAITKIDSEA